MKKLILILTLLTTTLFAGNNKLNNNKIYWQNFNEALHVCEQKWTNVAVDLLVMNGVSADFNTEKNVYQLFKNEENMYYFVGDNMVIKKDHKKIRLKYICAYDIKGHTVLFNMDIEKEEKGETSK